jgi:hypothetical protein
MPNRNQNDNRGGRNDRSQQEPTNQVGTRKRITGDDLSKAAEAARDAASAASVAADALSVAIEQHEIDENRVGKGAGAGAEPPVYPLGQTSSGRVAFEQFMGALRSAIKQAGPAVQVTDHARWVKIESTKNGHKVYVAKGRTQVGRVESTLPPELVVGAESPSTPNGKIASYIPVDPGSVAIAIGHLASDGTEQLRPPLPRGSRQQR